MRKGQLILMAVIMVLVSIGVANADWNEGDPYKMHYPQLPDPIGWDIEIASTDLQHEIADDWRCTETGYVSDIHFWTSWYRDAIGVIESIEVRIYSDDRTGIYSKPGNLLWSQVFDSSQFSVRVYGDGPQGWADPQPPQWAGWEPENHFIYEQVNITRIQEPFIQEEGTIYWLGIHVWWEGTQASTGWKTTDAVFEDTSVYRDYSGIWQPLIAPDGTNLDLAFVITGEPLPPELEFGDAPEGALAYPSLAVNGSFPTCITAGNLTWIQHNNFGAFFGPLFDFEIDGNAGLCPVFAPYDADECFQDGDAGLLYPQAYTIDPTPAVVPCPVTIAQASLGLTCQTANWGTDIDIDVTNFMPNQTTGYVNVLMDWNQDGLWGGSSPCPPAGTPAPEHVLVNFPVPNGFSGPLSFWMPPSFLIGPNSGYVWTRFSITEYPVLLPWDGSGSFEDGETEDYLLHIDTDCPPIDTDQDGIYDCNDNCPNHPNGPLGGTCTKGTYGASCTSPGSNVSECGTGGYCSMNQEDTYPPPSGNNCGDACECEGNFDDDTDQDGSDAANFKADFGRSIFLNPCTNAIPCNGDFDCDGDVDGTDAALFKSDFGRSGFLNPCPICPTHPWCTYP